MDPNSKFTKLHNLDEKSLREEIIAPLLSRMGFKAVTIYHGSNERGKDIICFDNDRLGKREYLAVVAKTIDLDGSVSSSRSLQSVVNQIEQCFDVPYEDLFGMTRVTMDKVWVITSHGIVSGAADSIFDNLTKRNLSKLIRFISGENLVQLIDEHYPEYWDATLESAEILKEQKHRLISFCKQILLSLGCDLSKIEETLNQVVHSYFPPRVIIPPDRSISKISSYQVALDSITGDYSHNFYSGNCGLIRDVFFQVKEDLYHIMFDVDEIVENYEEVIKKTDPKEFVQAYCEKLDDCYPFRKDFDISYKVRNLEEGLNEIDELRKNLQKIGKLEWAISLVDSIPLLEKDIKSYLAHLEKDQFTLFWSIDTIDEKGYLRLIYEEDKISGENTFSTEHEKTVYYYSLFYREKQSREITVKEIMNKVHSKILEHLYEILAQHGLGNEESL